MEFAIIVDDQPIYQMHPQTAQISGDFLRCGEFLIHSALDVVDEKEWTSDQVYLKVVDKFHEHSISAYITPRARFMVLHRSSAEEQIRQFCREVHDLYLKVVMNPFYEVGTQITTPHFDAAVRAAAKKHLSIV